MGRLFWKFFFSFWLTLLIAAGTVGTVAWLKQAAIQQDEGTETQWLDRRAAPFIAVAADIAEYEGLESLADFLKQLDNSPMPSVLAIDSHGKEVLGRDYSQQAFAQARQWADEGKRWVVKSITTQQGELLLFSAVDDDEATAQVPFKRTHRHTSPRPLAHLIWAGLLASLMFSGLLAWYFTRPIRSLKQAFAAVAEGKLDTRVSPAMKKRHDELAELGRNFDFMTAQIDQLITAQKQLLHDVSHELRSPLARMQAAIGIAQQQPDKAADTLTRLERETERMNQLIGELLLLSRLETGVNHQHRQPIDITALMENIIADARFEAKAKHIDIDYKASADILLDGQQELLHRAIENVIRNAIKFSHENSTVHIAIQLLTPARMLQITVSDEGPGVTADELEQIFRPFFRGQHAQRRDSIGLGLTIAQRAVEAHHGHIDATNGIEGGLQVIIELPLN